MSGSPDPRGNRPQILVISEGDQVVSVNLVDGKNPVSRVIGLAGGAIALGDLWDITREAVYDFERRGYLPLDRAKDAAERWTDLKLRDLVKPEIRDAMDRA
jgi:hypothetical protein